MSDDRYLTFALGKGRLAKKTLQLFEQIGITCEEMKDPDTRKLIFVNEELKLRFFLAKGPDVPTYVEYGAADIGVVGKDTILEEGRNNPLRYEDTWWQLLSAHDAVKAPLRSPVRICTCGIFQNLNQAPVDRLRLHYHAHSAAVG